MIGQYVYAILTVLPLVNLVTILVLGILLVRQGRRLHRAVEEAVTVHRLQRKLGDQREEMAETMRGRA